MSCKMKQCSGCKRIKKDSEFNTHQHGEIYGRCKVCQEKANNGRKRLYRQSKNNIISNTTKFKIDKHLREAIISRIKHRTSDMKPHLLFELACSLFYNAVHFDEATRSMKEKFDLDYKDTGIDFFSQNGKMAGQAKFYTSGNFVPWSEISKFIAMSACSDCHIFPQRILTLTDGVHVSKVRSDIYETKIITRNEFTAIV